MQKLWDRFEAEADRVSRIKAVATWTAYSDMMVVLPFGGLDVWASAADPGVLAETSSGSFALSPFRGELRYVATQQRPGEAIDFEIGLFATLEDALALAEALLVEGRGLRDIAVPREITLAELAAKPDAAIARPKLQYHEPAPPPPTCAQRWFFWVSPASRAVTAPFRAFFGGYNGCLTVPMMAVFILPCILFTSVFLKRHGFWLWIEALVIGAAIAFGLTLLGVFAFTISVMRKHMQPGRGKVEEKDENH